MTLTTDAPAAYASRRAIMRGAAWTVPVVAVAATAPAYAASGTAQLVADPGTAVKWGKDAKDLWHVSWDLTLTAGPKRVRTVRITFSYIPTSGRAFDTFEIRGFAPADVGWTAQSNPATVSGSVVTYGATATHAAELAALSVNRLHVDFAGLSNNSAGTVAARALITYTDGTTSTASVPAVSWDAGKQHTH